MEYCASAASMLTEEILHIAEGFVEVPVNQLNKCGKVFQTKEWFKTFQKPESKMCYVPQCAKLVE